MTNDDVKSKAIEDKESICPSQETSTSKECIPVLDQKVANFEDFIKWKSDHKNLDPMQGMREIASSGHVFLMLAIARL